MDTRLKILLIDDEDDFRTTLKDRLIFEGFDVVEARNGSTGIDLAREQAPNLILLDIMMPLMSGHRVWSELQKFPDLAKIPLLVLSAKMRIQDHFWKDDFLDHDYISKALDFNGIMLEILKKLNLKSTPQRQLPNNL